MAVTKGSGIESKLESGSPAGSADFVSNLLSAVAVIAAATAACAAGTVELGRGGAH